MRWLAFLLLASPAAAVTCEDITYQDNSYTACTVDVAREELRLFHSNSEGELLGGFAAIEAQTEGTLTFGMNAGMYHEDRAPVGLYLENDLQLGRLITSDGPGNFGLLPNGVFCIRDESALVMESRAFEAQSIPCDYATQSGPMLVIDGDLHPRFIPNGSSKNIRNGVGTSTDQQTAVFAISNQPVNFHDFASFFRDHLKLDQALYFDGNVSRLYVPDMNRNDFGFTLGPIVGVLSR